MNFLYGIPQYAISIAARIGDEVVAGVVVDVAKGEAFTATRGGGAHLDGRPIAVRDVVPLAQRLVITGFSYERDTRMAAGRCGRTSCSAGCATYAVSARPRWTSATSACGRADAYVEEGLNDWDLAAGGLVAEESGRPAGGASRGRRQAVRDARPRRAGFDEFVTAVEDCGFLARLTGNTRGRAACYGHAAEQRIGRRSPVRLATPCGMAVR